MAYDIEDISAPRAAGPLIRALAVALEGELSGPILSRKLLGNVGLPALRALAATDPYPLRHPAAGPAREEAGAEEGELLSLIPEAGPAGEGFFPETAADFVAAYREGRATPEQVAQRVLEAIRAGERHDPPLRTFIAYNERDLLEQARESKRRYEAGQPLGPLDGVPVAVKDELDQRPYPTTVGTAFLGSQPAREDAEAVARLRRAGALLIGKANMQEIGLGVFGHNPHYGPARNPYDTAHLCGGSSSGSAAAVAAGLCPIALGVDGGGSIRIPAAFCGQVGLMSTFGRVSEHGAAPLSWSVSHVGPIAASVRDAALAYALIAGPDPKDANTLAQPAPRIAGAFAGAPEAPLAGIKLGVYRPWFEHAEPGVVSTCQRLLDALVEAGAELREIAIPELGALRTVHLVTIVSEMITSQLPHYERHHREYSHETRVNLAMARRIKAADYVHAQRLRVRLSRHFTTALEGVDAIVTPAAGCTAPRLAADALETGESNLLATGQIMRFAPAANLTGLPTISFPAGYDERGLPVGMQAMGRYWQEPLLLRIAGAAERVVRRQRPSFYRPLLRAAS